MILKNPPRAGFLFYLDAGAFASKPLHTSGLWDTGRGGK